ncbi:MAG: ATP-binding protein, partial [Phenylobacterium sp.]
MSDALHIPANVDPVVPRMSSRPDFETFFAVSLDLLVIRDADFRIVKVNQAWERVLGWRADELEGRPMLSFIHPDDIDDSHAQMLQVVADRDVKGFTNRYRCRDGGYRHLEWRAHQEGDLVYGVARDVTERLAFEAEMAEARTAAEAANKVKSEFLANMSHEIRTPLNGIIGLTGVLAQTELSPQQREMVELVLASGHTLERVVSDVLDFSKIEAGQLELEVKPFDLRAQLDPLLDLFRGRAEDKGLRFGVAYGAGAEGWFRGDGVRINQVLGNLVANAIKFTANGVVQVTVEVSAPDGGGDPVLSFAVRDTGVGFDDSFAHRLFHRFSQADGSITRRFGGTGLGLSICQALVEMMRGNIAARSEPGRGSEFKVRLPLPRCEALAQDAAAGAAAQPAVGDEPLRVLLAEDHAVNQRVVQLILEPAGMQVTTVDTGEA